MGFVKGCPPSIPICQWTDMQPARVQLSQKWQLFLGCIVKSLCHRSKQASLNLARVLYSNLRACIGLVCRVHQ